jgi:hypothetical protein
MNAFQLPLLLRTLSTWLSGSLLTVLSITALQAQAECNTLLRTTFDAASVITEPNHLVVDTKTGLMWMRCPLGYTWDTNTCTRDEKKTAEFTWPDAVAAAGNHTSFAGYQDWRLPNRKELASIVEGACFDPAINLSIFPSTEAKGYWSSTPNNFNPDFAWAVNFINGDHVSTSRTNLFGVRLVRSINP